MKKSKHFKLISLLISLVIIWIITVGCSANQNCNTSTTKDNSQNSTAASNIQTNNQNNNLNSTNSTNTQKNNYKNNENTNKSNTNNENTTKNNTENNTNETTINNSKDNSTSAKDKKSYIKITIANKKFDLSVLLNPKDVQNLDNWQLSLLRNAYYAKHGYKFKIGKYSNYFSKYDWYIPKYDDVANMLCNTDIDNINLILKIEGNFNALYSKLSEKESLLSGLWFSNDSLYDCSRYYFFDDRTYAYFPKYKYNSTLKEGEKRLECILGNWYIIGNKIYLIEKGKNFLYGIEHTKLTSETQKFQYKILGGIPKKTSINDLNVKTISLYSKNRTKLYNNITIENNAYYSNNNLVNALSKKSSLEYLKTPASWAEYYYLKDKYYLTENQIKILLHTIREKYTKFLYDNRSNIEIYDTLIDFTHKNDKIFKDLSIEALKQFLGNPTKTGATYDTEGEVKEKYYDGIIFFYDSVQPRASVLIDSDKFSLSCGITVGDTIDDISSKSNIDKSKLYIKSINIHVPWKSEIKNCDNEIYLTSYDIYSSNTQIYIYLKNNKIQKIYISVDPVTIFVYPKTSF
ncbi:hypothetical protein CLTEP_19320 [Clostridium tepidiprofundi DSM 19306]|uniref:YARHG domain-containing protein n=1 Tax=Clostridium tepidiprofundi DSM 19306 TaxID=1121338 RepID=A0A151B2M8_9CLOT|nr:YARHG domain-containing protein [Clostridium tepidiprofundi]KYH34155.1 hypothetical protein CLTEP_19320 [Clostridium tepidiprofundi DSM 19306]